MLCRGILLLVVYVLVSLVQAEPQCKSCSARHSIPGSSTSSVHHSEEMAPSHGPQPMDKVFLMRNTTSMDEVFLMRNTTSMPQPQRHAREPRKLRSKRRTEYPSGWEGNHDLARLRDALRDGLLDSSGGRAREDAAATGWRPHELMQETLFLGKDDPTNLLQTSEGDLDGRWEEGPVDVHDPIRNQRIRNKWHELLERLKGEWGQVLNQGKHEKRQHQAAYGFFSPAE